MSNSNRNTFIVAALVMAALSAPLVPGCSLFNKESADPPAADMRVGSGLGGAGYGGTTSFYHSSTHPKITAAIDTLAAAVGNGFAVDFGNSPGFTITMAVSNDGQAITFTAKPSGAGPNNPFGVITNGHRTRTNAVTVRGEDMP